MTSFTRHWPLVLIADAVWIGFFLIGLLDHEWLYSALIRGGQTVGFSPRSDMIVSLFALAVIFWLAARMLDIAVWSGRLDAASDAAV